MGDRHRFETGVPCQPLESRKAHHEHDRGVGVDERQIGADDGHARQFGGGPTGMWVDDVGAPLVRGRRRHGGRPHRVQHGRELIAFVGMSDTNGPGRVGGGVPADRDVATGVDREVAVAVGDEDLRGAFDRPSLHDAGRVERRPVGGRHCKGVERAVRLVTQPFAEQQDRSDLGRDLGDRDVAPTDLRDRAVVEVGAERLVDVVQPGHRFCETAQVGRRVADVETDGRSHHVFDVVVAVADRGGRRERGDGGGVHHATAVTPAARAVSIADCNDRR